MPLLLAGVLAWASLRASAGGSGLNVAVVVNQASSNSVALGNYFRERRSVPPENVFRINWTGGNTSWSLSNFQAVLAQPLIQWLNATGLSNQISYVVLSMDIPFTVTDSNGVNSTTAALFYGFKRYVGQDIRNATNSYAFSENIFEDSPPVTATSRSLLVTMLTAGSLNQARQLVDHGVASDGMLPSQPVVLAKTTDPLRNVRARAFDNAIFDSRLVGASNVVRTLSNNPWGQTNLLGYQTGLATFSIQPRAFVAGAMADSMTSSAGVIFGPNSQTSLLAFIHAGASGSYGTVAEPQSVAERFPDPLNYFYQSRGFNLAECYYQSLEIPSLGLIVGEPLASPFRSQFSGGWLGLPANALLSGTPQLTIQLGSSTIRQPVQRVDLFLDGRYYRNLSNLSPWAGNQIELTINDHVIMYEVTASETIRSVASNLAAMINLPMHTNVTRVIATARGDRVELQSVADTAAAGSFTFVHEGSAKANWQYTAQPAAGSEFGHLTPIGISRGGFQLQVNAPEGKPCTVQASENLRDWLPIYTTANGGSFVFTDALAGLYPHRFYRLAPTLDVARPANLHPLARTAKGEFRFLIEASVGRQYVISASTNLVHWTALHTNFGGGPMTFVDTEAKKYTRRFYRVGVGAAGSGVHLVGLGRQADGRFRFRAETAATQTYAVEASSDLASWTSVLTNATGGTAEFVDAASIGQPRRFYRARLLGTRPGDADVSVIGQDAGGDDLLRVDSSGATPVVVYASRDSLNWQPIYTNQVSSSKPARAEVRTLPGISGLLTTHGHLARTEFLESVAFGTRSYLVHGSVQLGSVLRCDVTKTNGQPVSVAVTNVNSQATVYQFLMQLTNAINAAPNLKGPDGLVIEDLTPGFSSFVSFTLRARSAGLAASAISVTLTLTGGSLSGLNSNAELDQNINDLRPRNHLYISGGVPNQQVAFTLDTTSLADGFHDLTAVAYEGTHVHTQTHRSVPIRVQNSSLGATVIVPEETAGVTVGGIFHVNVTATTGGIQDISIFSTGGKLGSVTGQQSAGFVFSASALGAGLHPIHVIVTHNNGKQYRSETHFIRVN